MIDLDKIKADNVERKRKKHVAFPYPRDTQVFQRWSEWTRNDNAEDVIDTLIAAVERLQKPFFPIAPDHLEAICTDCGGVNVVWFAPSEWWNAVIRRPPDSGHPGEDPMLCPRCFIVRSEALGYRNVWRVAPEE